MKMRQLINQIFCSVLCLFLFMPFAQAQIAIDVSANSPGSIKVGSSTTTCNAAAEGTLQWNGSCLQGCDGSSWGCLNGSCDNAPDAFVFTDVTGAATSTLTESNFLQIEGMDAECGAVISVSGDGSPEWRLCSEGTYCYSPIQDWTSSDEIYDVQGNYLQVRTTSPATSGTVNSVTVNVGSVSDTWTVATTITGSCGGTPTVGDVCADGSVYAGITPDGNVPMYLARCDIGMSWSGSACTGTRSLLPWNDDNTTGRTLVGPGNSNTGELNTSSIIPLDSDSITGGVQPHQAAQACADLNVHGNTDWYLPAENEMWVIWNNLIEGTPDDDNPDPIITGFDATRYWSSTESGELYAERGHFGSGDSGQWYGTNKYADHPVRCARQD